MKPDVVETELSISQLIKQAAERLHGLSDSPLLDAQLLLCDVLQRDRSFLLAWPEKHPSPQQLETFAAHIEKRRQGIPVAYILGYREFWSLKLRVSRDVLVPRPETELLVELALSAAAGLSAPRILDLGTGSGAIALALALELPKAQITATDKSVKALQVAQRNATEHKLGNIQFTESDWFSALGPQKYDLIVSNPPYVEANDPHLLGEIKYEPIIALASGEDGLDDIRSILAKAAQFMHAGSRIMIEHGFDQGKWVCKLMQDVGLGGCKTIPDHAGQSRVTSGKYY